ncbi:MAG: hypothetical protein D6738_09945, partial [Acidobacteria bacterium]
ALLRAALAGLFAGLAVGTKLTGAVTVAIPAGLLVVGLPLAAARRRGPTHAAAAAALFGGSALVAFAPWAIRNAVVAGNPLHPYLGAWFATGQAAAPAARIGSAALDPAGLVLAPTFGVLDPRGAAGVVGAAFPLALVAALVLLVARHDGVARRRAAPLLLAVVAGTAGWSLLEPLGRYLAPVLVPAAALGGAAAAALARAARTAAAAGRRALAAAAVGVLVLAMLWGLPAGLDAVTWRRVATAFGHGPLDAELRRGASYWPAVPFVRDELPADARLLMVAEARTFAIDRDPVVEDPFEWPLLLVLAEESPTPEALASVLREQGITHVLFNAAEAARIARINGREDYWAAGSAEARATVFAFWQRCLEPRFREGQVAVYELTACRPAAAVPGS